MPRTAPPTSAKEIDRMRLVLKPDEFAPSKARARVSRLGAKLGPRYDDVVLVVSELVTNSVQHSASDRSIEMTVEVGDNTIRVEVTDKGSGFAPLESMRGDGLGLIIVDRVAVSWGVVTNGRCTVWVELSTVPNLAAESTSMPFEPGVRLTSG
jgi:anti-sigma regulatory factor (Ser/Thr protein kinase)